MSSNFCPIETPPPKLPGTFKTVGELIKELSKLDPDMPALMHSSFQLGENAPQIGYVPYNKIGTTFVIKTTSPDWYEKSNSPGACEVAAITSTEEIY